MILTIVKAIYHSMSNKFKGYYLLWVLLNFIIWIVNGAGYFRYYNSKQIYPFTNDWFAGTRVYDLSEMFMYSSAPILLFTVKWLRLNGKYANSLMGIKLSDWQFSTYYLVWIYIHFTIWLVNGGDTRLFSGSMREFLVFSITPLLIYVAIKLISKDDKKR